MSLRDELIQVAAVAMATVSIIDKQSTYLAFENIQDTQYDSYYTRIANDIAVERLRQEKKWGVRCDDDADVFWWLAVLGEEVGEACQAALEATWARWPE